MRTGARKACNAIRSAIIVLNAGSLIFMLRAPVVRTSPWIHNLMAGAFLSVLLMALLADGGVSAEIRMVLTLAVYILLPLSVALFGLPQHCRPVFLAACMVPISVIAYVWLQSVVHQPFQFAPANWRGADAALLVVPAAVASPADDRFSLLSVSLAFGVFLWGLVLFNSDRRASAALNGMAISGGLLAVWSILQFTFAPDTLGFGKKTHYLDSLTGFFVNRNTAATLFGLITLLLATTLWRTARGIDRRRFLLLLTDSIALPEKQRKVARQAAVHAVLFASAFAALMLTRSRAGIGAGFTAALLLAVLVALSEQAASRRWKRAGTVLLAALAVTLVFFVFAGLVLLRVQYDISGDGRFCVMPGVFASIGDSWPWGSGLAGFAEVYAPHHDPACGTDTLLVRAHSVFAEGMVTLGLFFPMLAVLLLSTLAFVFFRGARGRRRYAFAGSLGFAVLLLVCLHSLMDFSLQIPGLALCFAALLAPICTLCLNPPNTDAASAQTSEARHLP